MESLLKQFFKDKRVLVTGHTGFKGSWLIAWLNILGAKVMGYSLKEQSNKDNFALCKLQNKIHHVEGDIRDEKKLAIHINRFKPQIVFHLAAQPLVRYSYKEPVETYDINVGGTCKLLNVLKDVRETKTIIVVTTDKCYKNNEWIFPYRENDILGGYDPYSSSKACTEILVDSFRQSFFNANEISKYKKSISTVRAGNVFGGGDWAQDRIIPDCIHALENNREIDIRSPLSIRPWQHVLEPLGGYLLLATKMIENPERFGDSWNFGPNVNDEFDVETLVSKLISNWGECKWKISSNFESNLHEANLLKLDTSKSRKYLGWKPQLSIDKAIEYTVNWYKNYSSRNVYSICKQQIEEYMGQYN